MWVLAIDQLHPNLALQLLIQEIWKYILETWSVCNSHIHTDQGHLSIPDNRQAVRTMYEMCNQLPADTQEALFSRPLENLLEQSPEFLCKWIIRSNKYIKQQIKAAKKQAKLNTLDIQSFFGPHNPVDNDLHPP